MGTAREMMASKETVTGKPKDCGHLENNHCQLSPEMGVIGSAYCIPVQVVEIKDFCNPNQRAEIIEAIVDKEEEPKVDLHAGLSVTGNLAVERCHGSCKSHPQARRGIAIVALVRDRVLRERHCTPRNGLNGHMCQRRVREHKRSFTSVGNSDRSATQQNSKPNKHTSAAGRRTSSPYRVHHLSTTRFTADGLGFTNRLIK
jgi:hypothetical protein